jgi:hypothetical protein
MQILFLGAFAAACSGGGGGEVIDVIPDPEEPFITNFGLDTGDIDGDGLTDIVVAVRLVDPEAPTTGHIDVHLQNLRNPGKFLEPQRHPVDTLPRYLEVADLNGDLALDVIATSTFSGNNFIVLLHDRMNPGEFVSADTYPTISVPREIAVGDIDMDGFIDIAIAGEQSIVWHQQRTDGSFAGQQRIGLGATTLDLGDLDGDGLLDVVTQDDSVGGNLLYYLQRSNVTGSFHSAETISLVSRPDHVAIADLNGDRLLDIAAAGNDVNDQFEFFPVFYVVPQRSANPPTFTRDPLYRTNGQSIGELFDIGDVNGDGKPDVVIGHFRGGGGRSGVEVLLQTETPGQFRKDSVMSIPKDQTLYMPGMHAIRIADLNGDLLPDIAVSTDEVFVLFQEPGTPGRFGPPQRIAGQL